MTQPKYKMKNFDNSLRIYNRRVLLRTRMHTYTKKYIDNLFNNAVFNKCEVSVLKLTAEDIANYKLSLIKKKDTPKEDNNALKQDKTCKINITSKDDKKSKVVKISKNSKTFKYSKTSIDGEPAKKKQKLDTNGIDVLKLVLSREGETHKFKSQFKSALKSNKEIASTNAEEVPMVIDCDKVTESSNSSTKNLKPLIWVIDPKKMMDENNYIKWMKMISPDNKSKRSTNGLKKLVVAKPCAIRPKPSSISTKVNGIKHTLNGKNHDKGALIQIENIFKKYFSKDVQDTIVIIANILNTISMSNKHHKLRMDECFKKKSETEKLKERCDANRLHGMHKTILETKLKNNFISVVSPFNELEFDTAFKMFFLSILTVLRVLEHPRNRKGSIFKNLVLLLWNSLKNTEYNHPKVYNMFRSKTFRPECVDLISVIEDSRDTDPGVTERMSLFFVSTANSQEYFQAVMNAVTSDSNEDLALLIDDAICKCRINSKFKDPADLSTVQHSNSNILVAKTIQSSSMFKLPVDTSTIQHSNYKIPVTIQSSTNTETIQQWIITKSPNGTLQQMPVLNSSKSQTIGNNGIEPSIVTSQPINNFHTTSSIHSSLQKKASELTTSKVIPTKNCIVVTPTISNSPLVQVTASSTPKATSTATTSKFLTFKPSIQNQSEGSTIVLGNKYYQLVKGPTGTMRAAAVNGTNRLNRLLISPQTSTMKAAPVNGTNRLLISPSTSTMRAATVNGTNRLLISPQTSTIGAAPVNGTNRLLISPQTSTIGAAPVNGTNRLLISPQTSTMGATPVNGTNRLPISPPTSTVRAATVNGTNRLLISPPTTGVKCYARDCKNSSKIMCSSCKTVKYCSNNCQRLDWYASHINDCDRMLSRNQT